MTTPIPNKPPHQTDSSAPKQYLIQCVRCGALMPPQVPTCLRCYAPRCVGCGE